MDSFKERMQFLLAQTVETEGGEQSRMDAIALAVVDKAMKGDLSAINFIRELTQKREKSVKGSEEIVRVRVITEAENGN